MQVQGLANSFLSLLGLGSPTAAAEGRRTAAPQQPAAAAANALPSDGAVLRALAAQYDVHEITPRQFATLINELQAADAVSAIELADLAQLRLALDRAGFDPDEPLDLVGFVETRLRDEDVGLLDMAQNAENTPFRRLLAWLNKFDMLRYSEPLRAAA